MYNKKNGIIIQKRVIAQGARFMKYENETCPVCGEKFTADSDVVVCPDCGTPHHRECYLRKKYRMCFLPHSVVIKCPKTA